MLRVFAIQPLSGKDTPGIAHTAVAKPPAPHKIENTCASAAACNLPLSLCPQLKLFNVRHWLAVSQAHNPYFEFNVPTPGLIQSAILLRLESSAGSPKK